MEVTVKQVSSLHKIRSTDNLNVPDLCHKTCLAGERFSYQICLQSDELLITDVTMESPLAEHIRLYRVREANMDYPMYADNPKEDYITFTPGPMPDVLVPLAEDNNRMMVKNTPSTVWVKVDIPKDCKPGKYSVKIRFVTHRQGEETREAVEKTMTFEVISAVMPQQKIIYTRWFYADCIADAHNVKIFSEEHWMLIEKYIAAAVDVGVNMILVPVHTPPLDTEIGTVRPCVQLVDIEKKGDNYDFSFGKFHRFIDICKRNGVRYYEIAHLFSQWGAKTAPNILVTENGKTDYLFGWHTAAASPEYVHFLKQYIRAIAKELKFEGISENTYFHISDEPILEQLESYQNAVNIIRPLIGNSKTMDAVSDYAFYEKGLIECPVTVISEMKKFLEHDVSQQWTYYCCGPTTIYSNSFLAMPSYRIRVLGFLLYKFDIKGFLHWGFNFYNACRSVYTIDPYQTTSGDKSYPSGDGFIVYPGRDGAYGSIRGEVTFEAMQDVDICCALEQYIGRDAVVAMIDSAAGMDLHFDNYPKGNAFCEGLRARMIEKIKANKKLEMA